MAPAGTMYRAPIHPQARVQKPVAHVIIDDEGPTYKGGSSDDEDAVRSNAGNIKPTQFQKSAYVPESPAKQGAPAGAFSALVAEFAHKNGTKRPGDDMSYAYGNASKKSKQTAPARAKPVQKQNAPEPDLDIDDIVSANDRKKIKTMQSLVLGATVRQCQQALAAKKGNPDDATEYLLVLQEKANAQASKVSVIDILSDDEDELTTTPAQTKKSFLQTTKQQAKVPSKSITDKWGTQQPRKDVKHLDSFSPPKEPKQRRRLVQGRKDRSSPDLPDISEETAAPRARIGKTIVLDDSDDENAAEEVVSEPNLSFNERVLQFFNTCSAADLADTATIKPALAEHFVSQQPFRSLAAVEKVDDPSRAPAKSKRAASGEKVVEKVSEMLEAYEAVDFLVSKCEAIGEPIKKTMKTWGATVTGGGEIEMTSLQDSPGHDSGIGTPTDDEKPRSKKALISQPDIMNSEYTMTDYQVVGMNWLNLLYRRKVSCILADDMGLGKTYQIIGFLTHLFQTGKNGPHLIVVPAATLENWLIEFKKFSPILAVEPYYATPPSERIQLQYDLEERRDQVNVVVTTYDIAKKSEDSTWLRNYEFDCTIFDEGHVLKNASSLVTRKLSKIQGQVRVLLTGTPLQNNLKELMSLLAFIMPQLFYEKEESLKAIFEHSVKTMSDDHEALLSAQRIMRARSILTPFILRRKKSQVARNLPVKSSKVEFCDLTPEQNEIYQLWYNKAVSIRERRERGEDVGQETTHILMKLRQAAIHPWLFRRLFKDSMLPKIAKTCLKDEQWAQSDPSLILVELDHYSDMEVHTLCANPKTPVLNKYALKNKEWLASGKVAKMLELLRAYIAEGARTLIFSQFTMVLDILEVVLDNELIKYFRLDGTTRVDQRQDLINTFSEEGNDTPVFMLSTKAGGAGINLAAANKVIIFDSGFNPQDDIQAENRAHRIGQKKPVEVVRLVSKGTVEEAIYKMGLTKVELDQRVAGGASGTATPPNEVQETAAGQETKMTAQELEGLNMVEDMFFSNLKNGESGQSSKAQSPAAQETSDAKEQVKVEDHLQEVKNENAGLVSRTKRSGGKTKGGSSQASSSSRGSKARSQK